jgi:hypothetical protein
MKVKNEAFLVMRLYVIIMKKKVKNEVIKGVIIH